MEQKGPNEGCFFKGGGTHTRAGLEIDCAWNGTLGYTLTHTIGKKKNKVVYCLLMERSCSQICCVLCTFQSNDTLFSTMAVDPLLWTSKTVWAGGY